ncbi:L-dopachrome tautomerase-related protein [Myxosarcina sp. GI1(2024)]
MQDLAVDSDRGFVYIADSSSECPAIVAVDINRNTVRRFEGHPSLQKEERVVVMVEGKVWTITTPDGENIPIGAPLNPITLSADGETLFFGAVRGLTWYGVPTQLFHNGADDEEIGAAIEVVGSKPVTDGVSTDAEGNHFFTNLAANSVDVLFSDGNITRLAQDPRFLWLDSVRFGPNSWLYASINQLHRAPNFNNGKELGEPPYLIVRIWTGTEGQIGR